MRPVIFSYPAADYNAIAATQNITTSTGAYVTLNGDLTNVGAQAFTPSGSYAIFPGIQRTIGVFSTGNLSAVVFYASGLDTRGVVATASFVGASGGSSAATDAFATGLGEFHRVNVLFCTAAATSNFTAGTGATGSTRWSRSDIHQDPFNMTVAVIISGATTSIMTVQDTPDNAETSTAPVTFNHSSLATVSASAQSNYAYPARFVRGVVTAMTATAGGAAQLSLLQAG